MKAEQKGERGFQMSDPAGGEGAAELPPMNFVTLILSLSTSAMIHLGAAPPGADEAPEKDLAMARQTIDMLEVLREKTRGNLTEEEDRLFEEVLHDLHMRFVEASRG